MIGWTDTGCPSDVDLLNEPYGFWQAYQFYSKAAFQVNCRRPINTHRSATSCKILISATHLQLG